MANEQQKAAEIDALIKKADAEKEEKAKADAMQGEMMDKCLKALDSISKRMDAWEEKARKDAEAAEKEKGDPKDVVADADGGGIDTEQPGTGAPKMDSVKLDEVRKIYVDAYGDPSHVAAQKHHDTEQARHDACLSLQYEADKVYSAFCEAAPAPMHGTPVRDYAIKNVLYALNKAPKSVYADCTADTFRRMDKATFNIAKKQIFADAYASATDKTRGCEGEQLREYVTTDAAGRRIVNFAGESRMWLDAFAGNRKRLVGIRNGNRND